MTLLYLAYPNNIRDKGRELAKSTSISTEEKRIIIEDLLLEQKEESVFSQEPDESRWKT